MTSTDIALVLISGLGVLHGLFLAIILWTYAKSNTSYKVLSLLLLVLSFRVGKSVFLEFTENLDVKIIFVGLSTLMTIGPLFYFYILYNIDKAFQFGKKDLLHFFPFCLGLCFGFWVNKELLQSLPMEFFILIFAFYYGHYLIYLIVIRSLILKQKAKGLNQNTYYLFRLLFYGLLSIWAIYVLNLFDEFVPYILGPILYTIIAYSISFIIIRKGYLSFPKDAKYKTNPVSQDQIKEAFKKVNNIVSDEKEYRNPDLSLRLLSDKLNMSTQILSLVINKESSLNFNSFVNRFRIKEAIQLFQLKEYENHTIASIAFEVGFNSITSFNSAFKKETGKTPLTFRNNLTK